MSKTIEIGPYSAYAIAVKYGYTGSEEQWIKEQETNRIASEQARDNANDAAERAETALQQMEAAKTDALKALDTKQTSATTAVESAQGKALDAVTDAQDTATQAVQAEQASAITAVKKSRCGSAYIDSRGLPEYRAEGQGTGRAKGRNG